MYVSQLVDHSQCKQVECAPSRVRTIIVTADWRLIIIAQHSIPFMPSARPMRVTSTSTVASGETFARCALKLCSRRAGWSVGRPNVPSKKDRFCASSRNAYTCNHNLIHATGQDAARAIVSFPSRSFAALGIAKLSRRAAFRWKD